MLSFECRLFHLFAEVNAEIVNVNLCFVGFIEIYHSHSI